MTKDEHNTEIYRAISVLEIMWRVSDLPTTRSQELFSHVNAWSAWLCAVDRKRAGLSRLRELTLDGDCDCQR